MHHISTTPFGRRPVTAGLIKSVQLAHQPPALPRINKWEIFRSLCNARAAYDLTDRDLTVLNALLSFHQEPDLDESGDLVVFPSNAALSDRAHGMPESTLRRHISALVKSGVILRHDSPNGKRYAARGSDGSILRSYGFDLRPLLVRAREIVSNASEAQAARARLRAVSDENSLLKRDAIKLALYGQENELPGDWAKWLAELSDFRNALRRKMSLPEAEGIREKLTLKLEQIKQALVVESGEMSANDGQNERHCQRSLTESNDSDLCLGLEETGEDATDLRADRKLKPEPDMNVPLPLVLKACPDILPYARHGITHWHQLVGVAGFVSTMMGISPDAWKVARQKMGPTVAAVAVSCILQRVDIIRNPGGYLRKLADQASERKFCVGSMVMALLNGKTAQGVPS